MADSKKTINKLEAVRRAMDKLGMEAGRQAIHDAVKKEFGIDMSLDHISTYRGNIRSQAAQKAKLAALKPVTAPAAKPTAPEASTSAKPAAKTGGVSKTALVRKGFARLGNDAMPKDVQTYLKKAFALDVPNDYISKVKSELGKAGGKVATTRPAVHAIQKGAAQKTTSPKPAATTAKPAKTASASGGISLKDIETTKGLLGRIGAAELKALIDLLGK